MGGAGMAAGWGAGRRPGRSWMRRPGAGHSPCASASGSGCARWWRRRRPVPRPGARQGRARRHGTGRSLAIWRSAGRAMVGAMRGDGGDARVRGRPCQCRAMRLSAQGKQGQGFGQILGAARSRWPLFLVGADLGSCNREGQGGAWGGRHARSNPSTSEARHRFQAGQSLDTGARPGAGRLPCGRD